MISVELFKEIMDWYPDVVNLEWSGNDREDIVVTEVDGSKESVPPAIVAQECKKWAFGLGFNLLSGITEEDKGVCYINRMLPLTAETETEAIFRATNWVWEGKIIGE